MNKIKPVDFPHPVVPIMTFEQWRKSFLNELRVGSPEWQAFHAWRHHLDEFQRSAAKMSTWDVIRKHSAKGDPFTTAPEIYILNSLYHGTLPESDKDTRKRQNRKKLHTDIRKDLENLAAQAEKFVARLSEADNEVATEDDYFTFDPTPLRQLYREAAQASRQALGLLRRPYSREPDILDRCLGLIAALPLAGGRKCKVGGPNSPVRGRPKAKAESRGITESQAVALVNLALRSQGYKEEDLVNLDPVKARDGNVRKRLKSRTRAAIDVLDEVSAYMRKN